MTSIKTYTNKCVKVAFFVLTMAVFMPCSYAQDLESKLSESIGNALPERTLPERADAQTSAGQDIQEADSFDLDEAFTFEEDQQAVVSEESREDLREKARREAFDAALQGLLPLKPQEIRELLETFDRTQESVEIPIHPHPKPEVTVQTISLDPGTKPLSIKVAHGHVTTVNFVDTTGAPWPVLNITWAGNFEVVESDSEKGSHILRISPESEFAYGNMSIMMIGLETPIIMTLETSRDIVHYRFDAIIPERGPFANISLIENGVMSTSNPFLNQGLMISAGDEDITSVLEGVVPIGAEKLTVSGVDRRTSAYRFNGLTYIRTPLTLLSPGWNGSATSADGMHVYAIEDTPVLILSDKGKMVRARLSDREDILDER